MRGIEISNLKVGQKLARTIYDDVGRVLLYKGTIIKRNYIKRLQELGIPFVYVEDELVGPLEVEELLHDSVRIQSVKIIRETVEKAKISKEIDIRKVSEIVNKILDDIFASPSLLVTFQEITSKNLHFYNHCVSVAVLAIITGMVLRLDQLKLKNLGMGAILHDIGKSLVLGKDHTVVGFNLIRQNKDINIACAHVAYQHHERYDGQGYPRGLKEEQIHQFAAITAIADYYDNLVNPEVSEERMFPYQAIERVVAESGLAFHPQLVKAFSRNIAPYPIGSLVRINTGPLGVVIGLHKNFPTRPIIKLVTDEYGGTIDYFPEVDLLKEKTIFVNEIISEKERDRLGLGKSNGKLIIENGEFRFEDEKLKNENVNG
ncbi:MAG: HD domain-containing protein [Clostridia bacterium]|nr:HD domain-containing protein [Clostridia bacterium]